MVMDEYDDDAVGLVLGDNGGGGRQMMSAIG